MKILAVMVVLAVLVWLALIFVQDNESPDPVSSPATTDFRGDIHPSSHEDSAGSANPAQVFPPAIDSGIKPETKETSAGVEPGDPVVTDRNAIGPGQLPEDNLVGLPPEAGDPGIPGLAPEAYEPNIPVAPPEGGDLQSVEAVPPDNGGG